MRSLTENGAHGVRYDSAEFGLKRCELSALDRHRIANLVDFLMQSSQLAPKLKKDIGILAQLIENMPGYELLALNLAFKLHDAPCERFNHIRPLFVVKAYPVILDKLNACFFECFPAALSVSERRMLQPFEALDDMGTDTHLSCEITYRGFQPKAA